jgi:hypothetical protein
VIQFAVMPGCLVLPPPLFCFAHDRVVLDRALFELRDWSETGGHCQGCWANRNQWDEPGTASNGREPAIRLP